MGLNQDRKAKQLRKQSDWQAVQDNHPDVAAHIAEFAAVFGKPEMVIVKDSTGDVLLDSRRYE